MDIKSLAAGGAFTLLGILAGGGLYGFYVSQTSKLAYDGLNAYSLMGECAVLQSNQHPNPSEVRNLISKVERRAPRIFTSLAIVGPVSGQGGSGKPVATQVDEVLRHCVQELEGRLGSRGEF